MVYKTNSTLRCKTKDSSACLIPHIRLPLLRGKPMALTHLFLPAGFTKSLHTAGTPYTTILRFLFL